MIGPVKNGLFDFILVPKHEISHYRKKSDLRRTIGTVALLHVAV
jgi:hypothetical protein